MYKSPIDLYVSDLHTKINEKTEEAVLKSVLDVGIAVDKDELVKALMYDRKQYEQGYSDGIAKLAFKLIDMALKNNPCDGYVKHSDIVLLATEITGNDKLFEDIVEVVRCEECKNATKAKNIYICNKDWYKCKGTGCKHNGGHYCGYGIRKGEGK